MIALVLCAVTISIDTRELEDIILPNIGVGSFVVS